MAFISAFFSVYSLEIVKNAKWWWHVNNLGEFFKPSSNV